MCLLKIKMQKKRNEVNNTSSSGSAGGATVLMAVKHDPAPGKQGAGVSAVSPEAGQGEEEAAAQRRTPTPSLPCARQCTKALYSLLSSNSPNRLQMSLPQGPQLGKVGSG